MMQYLPCTNLERHHADADALTLALTKPHQTSLFLFFSFSLHFFTMRAAAFMCLLGVASAGTHYSFVKFEANGAVVTGNSDITHIGGEELDRSEWIQANRLSHGLKRDIGTGARVSGDTLYSNIEFTLPMGPAVPMLMQALERGHTVNAVVKRFHNRRDGQEEKYMEIVCTDGRLAGVEVADNANGETIVHVSYAFHSMSIGHVGEDGNTKAFLSPSSSLA